MPARIPETVRSAVIERRLQGQTRNKIAVECEISQGATSGIINDRRKSVGISLFDQLQDLEMTPERTDISVLQCVTGLRVASIMNNLGIKEDDVESFLAETYNRCSGMGLKPQQVAACLSDMLSFWANIMNPGAANTIFFVSQIPEYLQDRNKETLTCKGLSNTWKSGKIFFRRQSSLIA